MGRPGMGVAALVAALTLAGVACVGGGGEGGSPTPGTGSGAGARVSGELRLFSYSDGFDPGYLAGFYEQYPDVELKTASFNSNAAAMAKIRAGFEVDVLNSCVDEKTLEMVQEGMYTPLDVSRLAHWEDIFPKMKQLPGVMVDGEVYLVPVDAGTAGIMYNADVVIEAPDSWRDLFDPRWRGRAALEDLDVTAIDIGALAIGIEDPLAMSEADLERVTEFLTQNKGNFRTFWGGEAQIKNLFKSGEVVISSGYPGTAKDLREEGVNVRFTVAREGQMLWACGYGITPNAQNLDAAYALLNYYTSLPPQLYAAENWNYQVSNSKILEVAPPGLIEEAALDSFATSSSEEGASPLIPATPPKESRAWTLAWQEVKAA